MLFLDRSLTSDPCSEPTRKDTATNGSKGVASQSEEFDLFCENVYVSVYIIK